MKENNQNNIEELVNLSIDNIKDLAKTSTIVGEPIISPSGSVIIPISKVSVGFVVGGGEFNSVSKKLPYPFSGGSGGGASVVPIGFIVETGEEIRFVDTQNKSAYQTVLNLANLVISKLKEGQKNDKDE